MGEKEGANFTILTNTICRFLSAFLSNQTKEVDNFKLFSYFFIISTRSKQSLRVQQTEPRWVIQNK